MLAFLGTIWNDYHRASVPVMENYGVIQAKRGEGELSRGRAGATDGYGSWCGRLGKAGREREGGGGWGAPVLKPGEHDARGANTTTKCAVCVSCLKVRRGI